MAEPHLNPFLLAANVPSPDPRLLPLLRSNPTLASQQDGHGYSLLHAAASYDHVDLLRQLVREFRVDVNLIDEDGETCLFVAESDEVARCLVEELGVDVSIRNVEGQTAWEKILAEDDFPRVAAYLQQHHSESTVDVGDAAGATGGDQINRPPPLPPNMDINFHAVPEEQMHSTMGDDPDPDFRRRIEELAANENFNSEEGQRELRDLVTDAIRGVNSDDRGVRRRVD